MALFIATITTNTNGTRFYQFSYTVYFTEWLVNFAITQVEFGQIVERQNAQIFCIPNIAKIQPHS